MDKENETSNNSKPMAYDALLGNVDLKKVEEYLKSEEGQAELNRIANEPIPKWPKPTWEQLNTPMDI